MMTERAINQGGSKREAYVTPLQICLENVLYAVNTKDWKEQLKQPDGAEQMRLNITLTCSTINVL